jgi:hypothetical protein
LVLGSGFVFEPEGVGGIRRDMGGFDLRGTRDEVIICRGNANWIGRRLVMGWMDVWMDGWMEDRWRLKSQQAI